jgi:hypothetical protein
LTGDDVIGELVLHLTIWVGAWILLAYVNGRRSRQTGFLVYTYLTLFFLNHWFGAIVHALPWNPFDDSTNTAIGFRESTYGLLALTFGALLMPAYGPRSQRGHGVQGAEDGPLHIFEAQRIARYYLVIGTLSWIVSYTGIFQVPGLTAAISAGKQALLLAICLKCWIAWRAGNWPEFVGWLALPLAFPIVTTLNSGFLGFGTVAVITILTFVGTFYRPRWQLVAAAIAAVYLGLSLFVAYAQTREALREAVWGGEGLERRIDVGLDMLAQLRFFDIWDETHLAWIDWRLNQNELVGAAVRYTPDVAPFLYGKTVADAAIAVIPRAIWPDKPVTAGSGDHVNQQTGILFAEGTSIGMGQVLEFYINFGTFGIIVGFLLLGMGLRHMDDRLFGSMAQADWRGFAFWFVVGTSALQVGGSLAEISAAMIAGAVLMLASGHVLRKRGRRRQTSELPAGGRGRLRTTR